MPLTNSYNSLAQSNEQPEYQCLWEPIALNPASVATLTNPAAAGSGFLIPGSALQFGLDGTLQGVGSFPPLGFGQSYPGGDASGSGATGNTTFPFNWTVQYVDIAAASSTVVSNCVAGVCLGIGSLGGYAQPQALTTPANTSVSSTVPSQIVMVGKRGIAQLLFDATTSPTVVGHTVKVSTTHTGQFEDIGTATWTAGTTVGVVLQAVTFTSSIPQLVWCSVDFPV